MEPIRLWRWHDRMGVTGATTWHDTRHDPSMDEYIALPRAEYDALVKEREEAVLSALAWRSAQQVAAERLNAATARAEKAEAARDRLADLVERVEAYRAAWRLPYGHGDALSFDEVNAVFEAQRVARGAIFATLDALLSATDDDAPTPDDRRGEDGAWCEGGRG